MAPRPHAGGSPGDTLAPHGRVTGRHTRAGGGCRGRTRVVLPTSRALSVCADRGPRCPTLRGPCIGPSSQAVRAAGGTSSQQSRAQPERLPSPRRERHEMVTTPYCSPLRISHAGASVGTGLSSVAVPVALSRPECGSAQSRTRPTWSAPAPRGEETEVSAGHRSR